MRDPAQANTANVLYHAVAGKRAVNTNSVTFTPLHLIRIKCDGVNVTRIRCNFSLVGTWKEWPSY